MLLEERVARPVTENEAEQIARELYGLETTAKALPGEYDDNFHLTLAKGASGPAVGDSAHGAATAAGWVLKVMHPAREPSLIELQCSALQHLARKAPHLMLPRVVAARDERLFREITAPDGSRRLVWMLTYVQGTVLAKANPHSPELLHSMGRFL